MSYDVVKSVKIENGKVFINCACSNVYPRTFEEWESKQLSELLKEKGVEAVELEIMKAYEEGNFQGSSGKYIRALKVLQHMPEYAEFDWRLGGIRSEQYETNSKNRKERVSEFEAMLTKALVTQLPKDKFVIKKSHGGIPVYVMKVTKRFVQWTGGTNRKIYKYYDDAKQLIDRCSGSDEWEVIKIN